MTFVRQAGAAVVLVTLTLCLQCAGMAALIAWARTSLGPGLNRLGPFRSALLIVRFITAFVVLHLLEILIWAGFYRWLCFPSWESAFYFSTSSYATVGYGDVVLPQMWRTLCPVVSIICIFIYESGSVQNRGRRCICGAEAFFPWRGLGSSFLQYRSPLQLSPTQTIRSKHRRQWCCLMSVWCA